MSERDWLQSLYGHLKYQHPRLKTASTQKEKKREKERKKERKRERKKERTKTKELKKSKERTPFIGGSDFEKRGTVNIYRAI